MNRTAFHLRPEAADFDPYVPGLSVAGVRERFGLSTVIKMAGNENPLGISPAALEAVRRNAGLGFRYPREGNPDLVAALAAHYSLPEQRFVPGNGSDEIIDLLLRVCPVPGRHNVVASRSSFSMYRVLSRLCGVEFRSVPRREDFSFDIPGLAAAADDRTALLFLTMPDNPSGACPERAEVEALARRLPPSCLLVLDEAYIDFCVDPEAQSFLRLLDEFGNVAVLRTFSKIYGLAGLRLGCGILPPALAAVLRSVHMPFSVNTAAEAAGIAALGDRAFYGETRRVVAEGRTLLHKELSALGFVVYPSQANFLMFRPGTEHSLNAAEIFEGLLARGVIIRRLASYGLEEYLRVSVGTERENKEFIRYIRELCI
ncbi:MAG: histidinol-phosphate transaminase [Desulfovibrio sp.]|jgi:histidinol-phosphate aminotransferase|nr:histidinol-phosphate transaminase [Desulfovibrio sp.]